MTSDTVGTSDNTSEVNLTKYNKHSIVFGIQIQGGDLCILIFLIWDILLYVQEYTIWMITIHLILKLRFVISVNILLI